MIVYRKAWWCAASLTGGTGVVWAFVSVSLEALIFTFAFAAICGFSVLLLARSAEANMSAQSVKDAAWLAALSALGVVGLVGFAQIAGWVAAFVLLLLAASSPTVVRLVSRSAGPPEARVIADDPAPPGPDGAQGEPRVKEPDQDAAYQLPEPRSLSDAELCHAWRVSFARLARASDPSDRLRITQARARYLDELERRDRRALLAWLAAGARAAGDPSRYLMHRHPPSHG